MTVQNQRGYEIVLTSRERVLCALNHEEPDRVPVFFGTSGVTTMLVPAYERLKAHLGIKSETRVLSRAFQYARIDEELLVRLGSDGRPLVPRPAPSPLRRELPGPSFVDEWGITWRQNPGTLYYEIAASPLRGLTINDLDGYPWPDRSHPDRFEGLVEEARALHEDTSYATVFLSGVSPFEQICLLRGLDAWMMDLAADPDFVHALMRKVCDLMLAGATEFLEEAGEYVDVLVMGDDLGTQTSTLISPDMYRQLIKPYHAELIAAIKAKTPAKIFFHSDGNIYSLIGDLVEVGVDLLNPVQVSAGDMGDTARLKREFGDRLSFCGAIDTQQLLPYGTPADVRREVRRRIKDLAPGGGYVCATVHCIQPDVPLENICAMFDEALVAGHYPLSD
jgi:uroporphyrinogen decarboxylase